MSHKPEPPITDDNDDKAEPKYLKADDPGPCPKPRGCTCTWYPLSLGWTHNHHPKCRVHGTEG